MCCLEALAACKILNTNIVVIYDFEMYSPSHEIWHHACSLLDYSIQKKSTLHLTLHLHVRALTDLICLCFLLVVTALEQHFKLLLKSYLD